MEPAEVVLRFLEALGRPSESDFYLALFRAEPKERFAAITVDANVARHAWEAVTLELRFLAALGLVPVVVLGLFEPTEAREHASRIRRRLARDGVAATLLEVPREGDLAPLASELTRHARAATLPILAFLPDGPEPRTGEAIDQRFDRLRVLLTALETRKLIFLHRPGGIRLDGALVPIVNLTTDYAALAASKELSRKERLILAEARGLVEKVPHKLLVSVTSPFNLLRELFTTKGAGTLLRRGALIEAHEGFGGVDRDRLRALLESAFGRAPVDAFFQRPVSRVYLEESYRGAAIVIGTPLGAYLSKFAVDREAQGEGLGRDLWARLQADQRTIFWRARPANPIVAWYDKLGDGMVRLPGWNVYWKNLPPSRIPDAITWATAQPIDILPAGE